VLYTAQGAGSALGPPAAGLAVDLTGSYTPAIVASALLGLAAYAALLPLDARAGERPDTNHDR
jgi:cyanate permease